MPKHSKSSDQEKVLCPECPRSHYIKRCDLQGHIASVQRRTLLVQPEVPVVVHGKPALSQKDRSRLQRLHRDRNIGKAQAATARGGVKIRIG
jgi:hypothetical protein